MTYKKGENLPTFKVAHELSLLKRKGECFHFKVASLWTLSATFDVQVTVHRDNFL